MKLNDELKLVLDVGDFQAFHQPIDTNTYEANFQILSAAQGSLFARGLKHALTVGPRIAALTLKDEGSRIAIEREIEDERSDFGASALLAEIKRRTTILISTPQGWEYALPDMALQQGKITEEDWKEVESSIVFFTCAYYSLPNRERNKVLEILMDALGAETTQLSCEEYANSLETSTEGENIQTQTVSFPT